MIEEILNTKSSKHVPSKKFSISSIGGCWRKKYLEIKEIYKEEFSEDLLRLFNIGNVIHHEITKELIKKERNGFHLVASEVDIPPQKYFSGRIDNVISIKGKNFIVDVKSAGDWTIKNVRDKRTCDENYMNQVLLYMYFTGIHKGILLFVGKTKGKIEEIEVEYDEERAKELVKEVEDFFHNYVEKNIEPPRCDGRQWGCECCDIPKKEDGGNKKMNELVKIKWLKKKTNYKPGDTMEISEKLAEFLVKKGDCKIVKEKGE